ncbi:MAG: UvrB/UvrC motif-containing protein [Thermoleophilia bacterium]
MFADDSPDFAIDRDGFSACTICGEEGAVIHLLKVQRGAVTHILLCRSCAETLGDQTEGIAFIVAAPSAFHHMAKTAKHVQAPGVDAGQEENCVCAVCGTTSADLRETGLLGCPVCYQVFAKQLETMLRGGDPEEYMGKVPHGDTEERTLSYEVARLKRMLRELVETERFEEAAGVRDRLAQLADQAVGRVDEEA